MNEQQFKNEVKNLGVELNDQQLKQLKKFYQLLTVENGKYNLTSITEHDNVYLKHFFDSLTIIRIIKLEKQKVCDVGTGAGFPGIVLKICYPKLEIVLLDSTTKKIKFVEKVINELKLENITAINMRGEEYARQHEEQFDVVVTRAVASLKVLLEISVKMIKIGGFLVCMKGNISREIIESDIIREKLKVEKQVVEAFKLPVENSTRTLILYKKKKKTPQGFPRPFKDIKE